MRGRCPDSRRYRGYGSYRLFFLAIGIFLAILPLIDAASYGERSSITVVLDDNYPPYVFRNEQGKLVGKLVDEWKLWQEKTGITVVLTGMDWADCLRAMAEGKADVIDTTFRTQQRETFLDFLPPHEPIPVAIYIYRDIAGITDLTSLRGFVVGVKAGDACVDWLNDHGIKDIRLYSSYEAIINEAVEKRLKVFCMDEPPANFLIYKKKAKDDFRYAFPLYSGEFHRAVRKGDKELFNTVQKGFAAITSQEYEQIRNKWMGRPIATPLNDRLLLLMWIGAGTVVILCMMVLVLRYMVVRRTRELTGIKNHLEATLNALPDLLFEVDISGRFYDFHSSSPELLLVPKEDFIGKTLVDCLPAEAAEAGMRGLQTALTLGRSTGEYSLEVHGNLRWFEFNVVPKKMPKGQQPHFIILSRDITDKKRALNQAMEIQRQLMQAHKLEAVGRLAGGIAHNLNNFLMPVLGYAEMGLQMVSTHEKMHAYLLEIKKAAKRAAEIVKQILAFGKRTESEPKKIDLNSVIMELKNGLFHLLGENIRIETKLASNLFFVLADKGQMEQILMNLLLNARDAMPEGGTVTIETRNEEIQSHEGSCRRVILQVSDTGCGMSMAVQERIFDPFFTTKGPEHGTGLGLFTVYGIVKQHSGEISVKSEVGKGTVFTITFPAMDSDSACNSAEAPAQLQPDKQVSEEKGLNLLVVDDDEHIVSMVSMVLSAHGHKVKTYTDPKECLRVINEERPEVDIVVTDIAMPGISGIELWRELSSVYGDIKAIFMSGFAIEERDMAVLQQKNIAFLQKPFGITDLIEAIASLMKRG